MKSSNNRRETFDVMGSDGSEKWVLLAGSLAIFLRVEAFQGWQGDNFRVDQNDCHTKVVVENYCL